MKILRDVLLLTFIVLGFLFSRTNKDVHKMDNKNLGTKNSHYWVKDYSYEKEDSFNKGKFNSIKELFLGVFIAYFGGLIGIALGVLRVPALVYFLKMNFKTAGGVNLLLTVFIGSAAFLGHSFAGVINYNLIFVVVLPTIIGMYLGSRKVMDLNQNFLNKFVGIFLVLLSLIFSIKFI